MPDGHRRYVEASDPLRRGEASRAPALASSRHDGFDQAERGAVDATHHRGLDTIRRKLSGLINAIAEGMRAPGLQQKLDELEGRRTVLEAALAAAPGMPLRLMPNLSEAYRDRLAKLQVN